MYHHSPLPKQNTQGQDKGQRRASNVAKLSEGHPPHRNIELALLPRLSVLLPYLSSQSTHERSEPDLPISALFGPFESCLIREHKISVKRDSARDQAPLKPGLQATAATSLQEASTSLEPRATH